VEHRVKHNKKNCYRCGLQKEEGRVKQPFCRGCATILMREVRAKSVSVNIVLIERVLALLDFDSYEYRKLNEIIQRKLYNNKRRNK
jgi:hypothetical protein